MTSPFIVFEKDTGDEGETMDFYKRIEKNNAKIEKKLKSAPSVYIVVQWAKWCVKECKWTGRLLQENDSSWIVPEVYHWTDHNGEFEEWYTCPIHHVTSGHIYEWTFNKQAADLLAEALNNKRDTEWSSLLYTDEEMEEFFRHYA